jgi:hypothetical protein
MDTVPPYIAPEFPELPEGSDVSQTSLRDPSHLRWAPPSYPAEGGQSFRDVTPLRITGRGSCDAKGQIFAMYTACKELEAKGCTGFGLLILAGTPESEFNAFTLQRRTLRPEEDGGAMFRPGPPACRPQFLLSPIHPVARCLDHTLVVIL